MFSLGNPSPLLRGNRTSKSQGMYRLATVNEQGVVWTLRRNCSVSPRQLGLTLACLGFLSLSVAGFFWLQGAWMVLPFSLLEVLALVVAFVWHGRHAADGERISWREGRLSVEHEEAGQRKQHEFAGPSVRVDLEHGRSCRVSLRDRGRTVEVGRYIRPELRPLLARELSLAMRGT